MGELLRWCLYSPLRLVASLLALGLVVGGLVAWGGAGSGSGPAPAAVSSPAIDGHPEVPRRVQDLDPQDAAATETTASRRPVRRATRAFMDLYLRSPDGTDPRLGPALRRLVTPTLWRGLRYTDPARAPRGPVVSLEEAATGAFAAETSVTLARGPALRVELVRWTDGWRVADVRPDVP